MNRKTAIFSLALALAGILMTATAMAEHPRPGMDDHHFGRHGAENHLARLAESLNLTDEQSAEVLTVLQAAEEERRALHKQVMDEIGPQLCAQRQATHDQILAILTPEQADQFEQMMDEHDSRSSGRGPRGGMMDYDCEQ